MGALCRDLLISLAQEVFDAAKHPSLDAVTIGRDDAKRMLEAFVSVERPGPANEELRAHARATVKLAAALSHKRAADFRYAALCLEATSSVVNVVAIVAGRRDPAGNRSEG